MRAEESIADAVKANPRLRAIAEVVAARAPDAPDVFVVGGTVRDVLLGEERGDDIDLAVEGDAIEFAYLLAAALGGHATPHRKFGTAVVSGGDEGHVDVVTTRRESYDAPGALPTVEHAELAHDLHRRDFTINAMAASLGPEGLGAIFDPYGGRADLEGGVVRVLHDASFVDDPTRILRGITYEARFGFRFDEHTEALARACIASGHVGDLASSRLRDELVDLLEDQHAADGIRRLGELGADRAIQQQLRGDEDAAVLFTRAVRLREELGVDVPVWRLGIATLARRLTPDEAYGWLGPLKVRRRDVDRIVGAVVVAPRIVEQLRSGPVDPADVVALADPFAPDAPLMALALDDRAELREYFARLRDVQLEIGGGDLIAMGLPESPRIGEILGEVRRRKLNGELAGREAELAAARELVAAVTPA
jgi:tRNA nucleotidyltransferase (CCA-adding enzyme)